MHAKSTIKILIVEDMEGVLEILGEEFANMENFSVSLARNGQEGLNKALRERPDIILSDVLMPVLDGFGMVKKLREHKDMQKIPVIFLSILSENEYNHHLEGLSGIQAVLWKNELGLSQVKDKVVKIMKELGLMS